MVFSYIHNCAGVEWPETLPFDVQCIWSCPIFSSIPEQTPISSCNETNICISLAQLHSSLLYRHLLFNELKSMSKVSLLLSLYHPSTYQIHCHPQEAERYNLHFSSVDVLWIDSHSYCHWNLSFQSLSYAHWATATEKHWSVALFFQKVFHFINFTELRLKLSQHFHLVSFFVLLL